MLAAGLLTVLAGAAVGTTPAAAAFSTPTPGASAVVGGSALGSHNVVVDAPGAGALPKIGSAAYVLADLDSGKVLAAKDAHGLLRPASTLKVLTALTLMPRLDPTTVYTATDADARAEGSRAGMVPGATYTVAQLWQALFLVSGNDAASGLASVAGGVPQTVADMATTARSLGARDTVVRNPSGLDAPGQVTSAYDLAVIARAAMARADFRTAASTVRARFPGKMAAAGKVRRTFEIYTQDRLLLNYPGAIGIKTGWTTLARGAFIGAATRDGHTLLAVVLHSPGDAWRDSGALLTWGFHSGAAARPVGTLVAVPPAQAATVARHGTRAARATGSSGPGLELPTLSWFPSLWSAPRGVLGLVLLLVLVVALRIRAVRRRVRRRGGYGAGGSRQAHPRRVRLDSSARPAPTAAPTIAPRTVRVLPLRGAEDAESTTPTRTGS